MNKYIYKSIGLILVVLIGCNKDNEIVIHNPEEGNSTLSSLDYEVIEYTPAPGQYINEVVSGFNNIKTNEEACEKAKIRLDNRNYVSLGAWGGYLVIKLNRPVANSGGYDFGIAANSFETSNEPGIVWVMKDVNKNGLPDDEWFELKGSYYEKEGYQRNYWVTYYRPAPGEDTKWTDSNGESGYVKWLGNYHNQDYYYPNWISTDSYTLHGSKLPTRSVENPITGQWSNESFEWGYADNGGIDLSIGTVSGIKVAINNFRISDAIDENGEIISLDEINFIKVQTSINGNSGILGENSTELCGFYYSNK